MTDRELLELAAKAAGIDAVDIGYEWNPLIDDGDALRLAVKLNMTLMPNTGNKMAFVRCQMIERYQAHDDEMQHALRKAIVRVAAEIERNKK
jgi:hypothetical protein